MKRSRIPAGFTLIELLVVITIIGILMGLLFPAVSAVRRSADVLKAKNEEAQIVTAVKAYYTEYGKYPLLSTEQGTDISFGDDPKAFELLDVLRANGKGRDDPAGENLNPRRVVFLEFPLAKNKIEPKGGIGQDDRIPYDPWGRPYIIDVDGNYDNGITNPYTANATTGPIGAGVIVRSNGPDKGTGTDKNAGLAKDDVISWQ